MPHHYNVILFVLVVSCGSFAVLYKGDKCSLKEGSQGICKFIKECPFAVQLIKTGINPVLCGFEGFHPIVCCNDGKEETNPTSTTTTDNSVTSRTPGDISKQKCKEYAEYSYEKIISPTLLLKPHFTKRLVCDIPRNSLIVGSILAGRREFPHMAVIGFKHDNDEDVIWQCGGSLISENFVLTAAHCFNRRERSSAKIVVRFGYTNLTDPTHMQERTVSEVIPYPGYSNTKYHDICLLRLSENVKFNTYVRPACLQTEKLIPYDLAIVTGWGTVESGEPSAELLKVVLEFFSASECNYTYASVARRLKDGIVDDLMVCAGTFKSVSSSACQGDSGGPLQVYHKESEDVKCMYNIIGVTSFGKGCGLEKGSPMVHTRISNYIKWIEDTVWPN